MGQEHADPFPLLFGCGRLESEFDRLGVALVSREPELQTIQLRLAIIALVDLEHCVEVARRLSLMLVGSDCADFGGRSKDTWTQHAAAAAIDDRRIHRPVDRAFCRKRLRVNAGNEHDRKNYITSHKILLGFKCASPKVERDAAGTLRPSARHGLFFATDFRTSSVSFIASCFLDDHIGPPRTAAVY